MNIFATHRISLNAFISRDMDQIPLSFPTPIRPRGDAIIVSHGRFPETRYCCRPSLKNESTIWAAKDSRKYAASFLRKVLDRFSTLEGYSTGKVFTFRNKGSSVLIVLINHQPALTLVKQSGCVFLRKWSPVRKDFLKYQRLFLRHMGFDCVRVGKRAKLTLSPNNVLLIDPEKEYFFEPNRDSYIGGETSYDDLGMRQAVSQVYSWDASVIRPDRCVRSSDAV